MLFSMEAWWPRHTDFETGSGEAIKLEKEPS